MNDPDFNLLAALDPLPVSTEVITVSQRGIRVWSRPRPPLAAAAGA